MPEFIDRDEVRRLADDKGAVVAEVLPRAEYEWAHLAGAIHLPLKGWDLDEIHARLDPDRPVIVYCHDYQCDMSPRAAWRLESLGYQAFDYVAGKADWLAFGLPYEGSARLVGDHLTRDVATCGLRDRLGDVRSALEASRLGTVVVLNSRGVVIGRLDRKALDAGDEARAEQVMREGPTSVRPSEELGPLLERMRHADVDALIVTSSDGHLLGVFERDHGEEAMGEAS